MTVHAMGQRPITDCMLLSDVIASRAYNGIVSIHIMLLSENTFVVICTISLEGGVVRIFEQSVIQLGSDVTVSGEYSVSVSARIIQCVNTLDVCVSLKNCFNWLRKKCLCSQDLVEVTTCTKQRVMAHSNVLIGCERPVCNIHVGTMSTAVLLLTLMNVDKFNQTCGISEIHYRDGNRPRAQDLV